jgi:F-box protein 11
VYYVSTPELDDSALQEKDELAKILATRQFADWRELRFEPFTSPVVRKAIAQLANRMRDSFWRPKAHIRTERPSRAQNTPLSTPIEPAHTVEITAKTEPPTHVVDPYERGNFSTLRAAVKAARPGDRILVRPGLYQGGLVINKPLEIIGDGPVADIEIQGRGADAILFKANIGRISNLTLRQVGGEGTWYSVDITQGRLELEGCDISSENSMCVGIHGGADPRLRRNRIHGGRDAGVYVYDDGLGTLEDNEISGNQTQGVVIDESGNPTLRRNQIRDNKSAGVFIYGGGQGTLEDNEISGNQTQGVAITGGGNPTLRRNQIRDNKSAGVFSYDGGQGTLEDNEISGNQTQGVTITGGGNPTLRRNQIRDNRKAGVYVYGGGLGTLEDNEISGNQTQGVTITGGGNPTLRRNQIRDNRASGVYLYGGGQGKLEDNEISSNRQYGVLIKDASNLSLRRNRINLNARYAIKVQKNGHGIFEGNDLTSNNQGAWDISADSEDNLTRTDNRE